MKTEHALCLVLVSALAAPALAQNVVIAPVAGDKTHAIEKQLKKAVCREIHCAPASKVHAGMKALKRSGVDGVLKSQVHGGVVQLEFFLTSQPRKPAFKEAFALSRGHLSKADAAEVLGSVSGAVTDTRAPQPDRKDAPEQMVADSNEAPAPAPAAEKADKADGDDAVAPVVAKRSPEKKAVRADPGEAEETASASHDSSSKGSNEVEQTIDGPSVSSHQASPLILADLGFDVAGRTFGYAGLTTNNALSYKAGVTSPRISLEAYPLARSVDGIPQKLGLTFDGAFSVGLKSQLGSGPSYPTSINRIDVGSVLWLGSANGFAFAPEVGYRSFKFSTSAASTGTVLTQLPDVTYSSLRFSGATRISLTSVLNLHAEARLGVLPLLSEGPLVGQYFSKGSGLGYEGEAGLRAQFTPNIGVGVFAEYTHYGLSFSSQSTDQYQAKGATDDIYGAHAAVTVIY